MAASPTTTASPLSDTKRLDALEASVKFFQQSNDRLRYALADAQSRPATLSPQCNCFHAVDGAPPDFFTGNRDQVNAFITQLMLNFKLRPCSFKNDTTKVLYALSYMRGRAQHWYAYYFNKDGARAPWLDNFDEFCKELRWVFGDPDNEVVAERNLYNLRQNGTITDYIIDFRRFSAPLGWNDSALAARFYYGLKSEVKDQLPNWAPPAYKSRPASSPVWAPPTMLPHALYK